MPTAQVVLRDLLRERVAPVLREHGFAGSGQDFHHRIDGNWAAVNVQHGRSSTADEVRFTINLGTASTAVRVEDGNAPDEPARAIDCHWRTRIGTLLPDARDTWWSVRAAAARHEIERLGDELARHLSVRAVPRLEAMAPDAAILATVLDGEPRAGLPPARMDIIGPILRRLGPPERLAHWLSILDLPSEGEAAAMVYALDDDFPPARMGAKRIEKALDKLRTTGFEPRQRALIDLGFAAPEERILLAIRPRLDDPGWRIRLAAAQSVGRLGDLASSGRLALMVRAEPARTVAVHAAFALLRLDRALDEGDRGEARAAIAARRERAVGHDRAALSHVLRVLVPD